ncbi:MAG: SDR family oxidoreductase [Bacteroidota bacterium]|nr:SDR family oxidoreductase [Bacteroidota bacterium]
MKIKLKPLDEQVIVITGASSGIGLATAYAAAKEGARLVLAARSEADLDRITQKINSKGGESIFVVADVGKQEDVERIATAANQYYGGFDTWVNDAGVSIYGRLDEVSDEDNRRLFDTNFWGVVYGSLVAAKDLRGRGGAIINIGSELSDLSIQIQGMYSASKHAVKGFTDALRIELEEADAPVSITLIKPAGINTPYTQHAKNYTGREATLPPPVYEPEEVAYAILKAAVKPHRDIMVGGAAKLMSTMNKVVPSAMDWMNEKLMTDQQLKDQPERYHRDGLHNAAGGGKVHGNYDGHTMKSVYTRAVLNPVLTGVLAVAAAAGAAFLLSANSDRREQEYYDEE